MMAGNSDDAGSRELLPYRNGIQMAEIIAPPAQTAPPPAAPAIKSELEDVSWTTDHRSEQLLVQAATIEQLQVELESAATEVIALKIAQHGLLTDAARQTQELEALRAELLMARSSPTTPISGMEIAPAPEPPAPTFDDAQAMPSRRWTWIMLALAVATGVPAWWISTGFRW